MEAWRLPGVIAHRGAHQRSPENTLAGMREAKECGARWIECDVMLTRDHTAIVFHDEYLNRTSNGSGKVANTDYETIKTLDAGSWLNEKFAHEPIPTLEAYLQQAAQLNLGINIELKANRSQADRLTQQVLYLLQQHWSASLPPPLLSSFSEDDLSLLRQEDARVLLGLNVKKINAEHITRAQTLDCYSIHVDHHELNPAIVAENTTMGFKTLAYTINERETAEKLWEMGVSAIFTDNASLY